MGLQPRLPLKSPSDVAIQVDEESGLKGHTRELGVNRRRHIALLAVVSILLAGLITNVLDFPFPRKDPELPTFVKEGLKQCDLIARPPPHPKPFTSARKVSDRFVEGTKSVLLKNGTVWTGEKEGEEILYGGSVLLQGGVIKAVGDEGSLLAMMAGSRGKVDEVDLHGAWVTPGASLEA
jgi:hypothetical protein